MSDTQDIDFGLALDVTGNQEPPAVLQGPWGRAPEATEEEVATESRDRAREARRAKPTEKRVEEAAERMKARVMASMAEVMESDELSLDERLAKMALLAKRYVERPAYKAGDLVTPSRKVQGYRGYGEPHIVLDFVSAEDLTEGKAVNTADLGAAAVDDAGKQFFGGRLDMRVLGCGPEGFAVAHCVESWAFENWTPPVEEAPPAEAPAA